jgi:hypothetical protein
MFRKTDVFAPQLLFPPPRYNRSVKKKKRGVPEFSEKPEFKNGILGFPLPRPENINSLYPRHRGIPDGFPLNGVSLSLDRVVPFAGPNTRAR